MRLKECEYCCGQVEVIPMLNPPPVRFDKSWERLESEHNEGCEWVRTRAFRVEDFDVAAAIGEDVAAAMGMA